MRRIMRRKRFLVNTVIAVILLLEAFALPAMALEVNDVAGEFICNCGCNKLLSACEMKCGDRLRGFIREQIDKGLGKEQIIQFMKVNFSEALLAAPEKKGFNLMAWLTPFAFVAVGAVITRKVVASWVSKRRDDDDGDGDDEKKPTRSKVDKKYDNKVEEELKDYGW
ncbi:MAG TPA: hypothetical protein ENI11_05345 [Actinobacteria bacterium]|nr:hypothetical protein [Actinomycetota bacterium]